MTRNERRKAAKQRLLAKQERIARAELGRQADERRAIVRKNMSAPRERNYYPQSSMAGFGSQAARAIGHGVSYTRF